MTALRRPHHTPPNNLPSLRPMRLSAGYRKPHRLLEEAPGHLCK